MKGSQVIITDFERVVLIPLADIETVNVAIDDGFVQSINTVGLIHPILLRKVDAVGDGKQGVYRIIDGHRRVAAKRKLGEVSIEALIMHDRDPNVDGLVSNLQRSPSPIAEADMILNLLDSGWTEQMITDKLGIPKARIRERLKLHGLHEGLKNKVTAGKMTISTAKQALKLPEVQQAALSMIGGRVTTAQVKGLVRAKQMKLLDLDSIEIPEPDETHNANTQRLAMELTRIAQSHEGDKKQTLLEAAVIVEEGRTTE